MPRRCLQLPRLRRWRLLVVVVVVVLLLLILLGVLAATTDHAAAKDDDAVGIRAVHARASPGPAVAQLRRVLDARFPVPEAVARYIDAHAARAALNYEAQRAVREVGGLLDTPLLQAEMVGAGLAAPKILDAFYPAYRDRYPHALTYEPKVDCRAGRYLLVDLEHGGFGVSTGLFIRKWMVALAANLTAVFQPFYASHEGESPEEQNAFWQSDKWEVKLEDLQRCPPGSAVWTNALDLSRGEHGSFEMYDEILHYASYLYENGLGGTVRLPPRFGVLRDRNRTRALFHQTQWLLQARWSCRNNPYGDGYLRPALLEAARGPTPVQLAMSIHIRRGDIMNDTAAAVPLEALSNRYRPVEFYTEAANALLATLDAATPGLPRTLLAITVYSEGSPSEFDSLLQNLTRQGYRTVLNLDTKTSRVFASLAESEINVLTVRSEFSHYWRFNLHHLRVGLDEFHAHAPVQVGLSAQSGFTVAGYAFRPPDAAAARAETIRRNTVLLWRFLVEWKLRRAEWYSGRNCTAFSMRCILSNPYTLWPLGPVTLLRNE